MLTQTQLRERIKHRLAALNRSPLDAAKKGQLERTYLHDFVVEQAGGGYKKGSINPGKYSQVAKGLDWTVEQLLGQRSVNRSHADTVAAPVEVPEIDVRAGAAYAGGFAHEEADTEGGQIISRDAVSARWGIPAPFLRQELRIRPGRVHILPVRGDSMRDALFDGDRAIVDLDDIDVSQGGIFAILDDNASVIIKQVELVRGKGERRILCTSRNVSYQPFELQLTEPVRIIGRVAGKLTRL